MKDFKRFLFSSTCLATLSFAAEIPPAGEQQPPSAVVSPKEWNTIVDEIVATNPEAQFYNAEIDAARAGRRAAGSFADPSIGLEIGRKRVRTAEGLVAGEGTAWTVTVSQTFEWPGRLALRKALANHDVALAELGLARFKAALRSRAATLAFGLHAAGLQMEVSNEVAGRFAALKNTLLAREPGGLTPTLEARTIEAREIALQRRASADALVAQAALVELNQLRGLPADAPLRVAPVSLSFASLPERSALLSAARENHFDTRARKLEIEQQGIALQLAKHERKPSLTVSPYVAREKAGDRETTVGIGLSVPLPVGARSSSAAEQSAARLRQAEAALGMIERDRDREVLLAAEAFTVKTAELARWTPDTVARLRETAALADRHYRLGAVPLATYLELQSAYLEAVEALLVTQREALEAAFRLQELTGAAKPFVEVRQ